MPWGDGRCFGPTRTTPRHPRANHAWWGGGCLHTSRRHDVPRRSSVTVILIPSTTTRTPLLMERFGARDRFSASTGRTPRVVEKAVVGGPWDRARSRGKRHAATAPATIVPLACGRRKLVLVGDHRQLLSMVLSTRADVPPFLLDT